MSDYVTSEICDGNVDNNFTLTIQIISAHLTKYQLLVVFLFSHLTHKEFRV